MVVIERMAQALLAPRAEQGPGPDTATTLQNRGPILLGTCISLTVVMVIVMITRVYCRVVLLKKVFSDDWFMILASICAIGLAACSCIGVSAGVGKHQWVVPWQDSMKAQTAGYASQIFYFLALGFCKASLLLFIIRLRPPRGMIIMSWSVFGFCTAFAISAFISSCLLCLPVSYIWDQLDPNLTDKIEHHCVNQEALQYSLPAINILSDLVVWLLPIKMVWKVQVPKRQWWCLIVLFSLGGLGVLAGIFRLNSIRRIIRPTDTSWNSLDITLWSNIEVLLSITFGSAPAVKPFFTRYLPSLLGAPSPKPYRCSGNRPFPGGGNHAKSRIGRTQGNNNTYTLGPIPDSGVSRTEHGSTEEFHTCITGGHITTGIEEPSRCDGESEEYRGGELVEGIVKSTDV